MANSLAIGLKFLFAVLGLGMLITLIYTISIDGLPFRKELLTPWMAATLVDFYINVIPLAAWVVYKESNWISAIVWIVLLICLGSITTCGYIVMQFMKLSPQESAQDPLYHVLLRHPNKDDAELKGKHFTVVSARVIFSALGCLMIATLLYTILTDGSPFRKELFTPWLTATLIDFYINVITLSVWVAYKESSLIGAVIWITLLICLGSFTTCVYIVRELFQLTSQDPLYLVLLKVRDRAERRYEVTSS
ncbi:hypothetical protein UlMin_036309 [Ulmus minor]